MTERKARVGVIGAGVIGQVHLRAYAAAGTPPVAVTDTDTGRAQAAAERHGLMAYPDLAAMLAEADLDAVSVCTPPATHLPVVLDALAKGVAVLCEKPMALTEKECATMIAAAADAGLLLSIGFCHRFQPEIEAIRAAVLDGRIGTVLGFHNRFSGHLADVEHRWFSDPGMAGGGVLVDTCSHSVDLFRYLVGEVGDVRALTATTATALGPAVAVEDTAVLSLRSTGGVLGTIEASWRTRPGQATVALHGTHGALRFDYRTRSLTYMAPDGETDLLAVEPADRFERQAAHFLRCVQGFEQPRVTAHDGAAAVAILTAAYRSAGPLVSSPLLAVSPESRPSIDHTQAQPSGDHR